MTRKRSLSEVIVGAIRLPFTRLHDRRRKRIVIPTDGGGGLQPGVDLEDREAMAELLGDNLPPGDTRCVF